MKTAWDAGDRAGKIGRKGKSALPHVVADKILQAGLEDRHLSGLQGLDFLGIRVDTNDSVPEIRETGSRHEPHIAGTDHCNKHSYPPKRGAAANDVAGSHSTIVSGLAPASGRCGRPAFDQPESPTGLGNAANRRIPAGPGI